MSIENRLKDIEKEVASIRRVVAASAELPVGSVIQPRSGVAIAIRLRGVHDSFTNYSRKASKTPVWVTVFNDFSGSTYSSLEDLIEAYEEFADYKVLRRGTGNLLGVG